MKFRIFKVGIVADIEKAFLQILIATEDRDATRFIWLKDIQNAVIEDNLQHYRFLCILFRASPSPFMLNATLGHHLRQQPSDDWVAEDMGKSL